MKKSTMVLVTAFMLIGTHVYAASGDLIVNGKLGVGTITPSNKLHINGGITWGGINAPYGYSSEDGNGLYVEQVGSSSPTSKFRLQSSVNGTFTDYSQFFIDPSKGFSFMKLGAGNGNVGIGTSSPGAALDIVGSSYYAANNWGNSLRLSNASALYWAKGATYSYSLGQSGDILYFGRSTSEAGGTGTQTYDMVMSGGNVGIGTTSPLATLQVARGTAPYGTAVFQGTTYWSHFNHSTSEDTYIRGGKGGSVVHINDGSIGNVHLVENGGNVGIGTSPINGKLHVAVSGNTAIYASSDSIYAIVGNNTGMVGVYGVGSIGVMGRGTQYDFSSGGGEYAKNGVWTNGSDRNIKENYVDVDNQSILNKISELPMTQWNYKSDINKAKHIGPIAQDFYAIFGLGDDEKHVSTIDPAGVALVGIKALNEKIQDQQKQIDELRAELKQIDELRAELKALKKQR